jgi:IS1 family transposase
LTVLLHLGYNSILFSLLFPYKVDINLYRFGCRITKFYTDGLKTYERHILPELRQVSKYKMQKIERKYLTLRTRIQGLARQTICFGKSEEMYDIVIGLCINK